MLNYYQAFFSCVDNHTSQFSTQPSNHYHITAVMSTTPGNKSQKEVQQVVQQIIRKIPHDEVYQFDREEKVNILSQKKRHCGTKPPIYTEKIFFHSSMLALNELTSTVYHTMLNQIQAFHSGKHSIKMGPTLHNYLDHPCMQNKILKKHTYTH